MSDLSGPVDPLALAADWLPDNSDPDRPRFTLGTTGIDGYPAARTVLLTALTVDGFCFNTDAHSQKVADIGADPRVSLVFVWPGFTRQLVVQGLAIAQPDVEKLAAYNHRSPYLKALAWMNSAQFARRPLAERRAEWARMETQHPDGPAEVAPTWDGYVVRPTRLLFWEAASDTASRRTEYRIAPNGWQVDLLPG
jgi:pyridoxamine 5'-phosphate oxidase